MSEVDWGQGTWPTETPPLQHSLTRLPDRGQVRMRPHLRAQLISPDKPEIQGETIHFEEMGEQTKSTCGPGGAL